MALRSMTACGRATLSNDVGRFTVDIQSLNRKHFDLSVQLPPELYCFESDVRKWIFSAVSRGQLTFRLAAEFGDSIPIAVKPNLPFVRQLKSAWEAISSELGLSKDIPLTLEVLSKYDGILLFENIASDDEALHNVLQNAVNMSLDKLVEMKIIEGQALNLDISKRLVKLEELLVKIVELAPHAVERYRIKIKSRLDELLNEFLNSKEGVLTDANTYADRIDIAREVGHFADRIDISEEVARFRSHLVQFVALLDGPEIDIGKTLEFIVQEMKREINTIGAKSLEKEIGQLVIEMKTEVERIREQIQNVE
ncbi:MAG: YicC family protein [Parachlamydiaceae bacterium]|nr:YicC family protein [Parachlamydiaceae bacterium]